MSSRKINLIVMDNIKGVGCSVNEHLKSLCDTDDDFFISVDTYRFSNGEGKVKINGSVRDGDVYILTDVGNYGITYPFHGQERGMSPDEHYNDIKRVISAMSGHADRINLIMTLLYQSRQHRKKGNESLDCAVALQELERIGVDGIITFDAHAVDICNAIPNLPFENFYPTNYILEKMFEDSNVDVSNFLVISPDTGALDRARYYAGMLGCDVGAFYKRRDYSRIVNGKNPVVEHAFLGGDVRGKDIIIVDDMIASGGTMIDSARKLKEMGAKRVYFVATFALFTEGYEKFNEAYEKGYFDKIYAPNLSYVPDYIKNMEWYNEVDCSRLIAEIIYRINRGNALGELHKPSSKVMAKVRRL